MDDSREVETQGSAGVAQQGEAPRSAAIANRGIRTGQDFANLMSGLMSDLIAGRVTPSVGNATCNAGGKLLKVVELQYKYGKSIDGQTERMLALTPLATSEKDAQVQ